jgi:hypothetical protein
MATRYNYTGGIVTNGLVLNLDAAKLDSYPGTGTTWYDISGNNNNGTLTNGPTFSGIGKQASIVFDGTNDYVNVPPVILNTPWSLCTTVKASNSGFPALYSQDGLYLWVGVTPNLAIGVHTNFAARVDTPAGSFNLNQVYFVGISSSPSSLTVYINDTKYSLTPGANPTAASIASIASYSSRTKDFLGGRIYNFSMYNRALTDTEITQNFNALRGRYGI